MSKLKFIGIGDFYGNTLNNTIAFISDGDTLIFFNAGKGLIDFISNNLLHINSRYTKITFCITHNHSNCVCELAQAINLFKVGMSNKKVYLFGSNHDLKVFLRSVGISDKLYSMFTVSKIKSNSIILDRIEVEHDKELECYGFLVTDLKEDKTYYVSGETKYINKKILSMAEFGDIETVYQYVGFNNEKDIVSYEYIKRYVKEEVRDKFSIIGLNQRVNILDIFNDGFDVPDIVVEIE